MNRGRTYQQLHTPLHLLFRLHPLQKSNISTRRHRRLQPLDRLIEPKALQRIRPCNDNNIVLQPLPRRISGTNASYKGISIDELFAQEVAAALGRGLVLDVQACDAFFDVLLDLGVVVSRRAGNRGRREKWG